MSKQKFYMSLAETAANQSKDPHTKVGACVVKDGRVLSLGWNGAPRDFPDTLVPWERDTDLPLIKQKFPYIVHAEMNAVLNYGGAVSDFAGSSIYVTVSPCYDCAKMLAQLRIKEVIYKEEYHRTDMWEISKYIFDTCGIKYRKYEETL